jgi:D-glycero-D-manno-heptose 1,7-bisphosphate phosphatase
MTPRPRRTVFLDRDGTLNVDSGYIDSPERVELLEGVPEALKLLEPHFLLAVVSNQSGIARGFFGHEEVARVHGRLEELLALEGAAVDAVLYCPHQPDDDCDCRKPLSGLLQRAAQDLQAETENSWMVGDRASDIEAGVGVGARTILLPEPPDAPPLTLEPDFRAGSLLEAARIILREEGLS